MIKNLIKVAADLDKAGFHVEADLVDNIMQKIAEESEDNAVDFHFLSNKSSDKSPPVDDVSDDTEEEEVSEEPEEELEEESEEEEEENDEAEVCFEDCLAHCKALSHEEQIAIIKAILDDMV